LFLEDTMKRGAHRACRKGSTCSGYAVCLGLFFFLVGLAPGGGASPKVKSRAPGEAPSQASYEPTSSYMVMDIVGWKVYVHKELGGEKAELGDEALEVLRFQLYLIGKWVPAEALCELKKVPIWMGDDSSGKNHDHPNRKWLVENGYNPEKAKSVDIERVGGFVRVARDNVCVLMHELAHAYHDRALGFDDARILEAYKKAVKSGRYESVLRLRGRRGRHYALTDHKEYFAESSEAFFGTNDFYPFVRAELQEHDPEMYKLLREIWLGK
jgi:hypothetical protein